VCDLFQTPVPETVISAPVLGGDARLPTFVRPRSCAAHFCSKPRTQSSSGSDSAAPWPFALLAASRIRTLGRTNAPLFRRGAGLANAAGPVKGAAALAAAKTIAELDTAAQARILEAVLAIKRKYDNLNLSVWAEDWPAWRPDLLCSYPGIFCALVAPWSRKMARPPSTTCWPLPCRSTTSTCART